MKHSHLIRLSALIICAIAFLLAGSVQAEQTVPQTVKSSDGQTLKLVWHDEFNGTGLPNPADWTYEYGFIRNGEKQFYTKNRLKNVYQKDGKLTIEAFKEDFEENDKKAQYTSGSITTFGRHSWTYGRIEVRAKLPKGVGTWPAIWMLGENIHQVGWPACGEIDIMEYVGFNPTQVHATVHAKGNKDWHIQKGANIRLEGIEDRMAVYAVEWTKDKMDFFVDDQKYYSIELDKFDSLGRPFDLPHYLILNLAIGGGWGGQKGIDDSIFPVKYEFDYVRVYQAQDVNTAKVKEKSLFDGTLKNWSKVTKYDFDSAPDPKVVNGAIQLPAGNPGSGIKYNGRFPKINYELTYQARRVDGNDFFGLAVIPYKDKCFGFVLGGWGGSLCGFSCLDGFSADENSSTFTYDFKNNVWYDVKLVITEKELVVYINGEKLSTVDMEDRTVSNRMEVEPIEPFGFATWYTTGEIRNIVIRKVEK